MLADDCDEIGSFIARLQSNRSLCAESASPLLRVGHSHATNDGSKSVRWSLSSPSDAASLVTWLEENKLKGRSVLTVYTISAPRSRAPLGVSGDMLKSIMIAHDITPQALDITSCVYAAVRTSEEAYCAPFVARRHGDVVEYSYMAKYVEHADCKDTKPSILRIRQTGVYHQYNEATRQSIVILFSPRPCSALEESVFKHIKLCMTEPTCQQFHSWLDVELLRSYMPAWRLHARSHETALQIMIEKLIGVRAHKNSAVEPTALDEAAAIEAAIMPTEIIFRSLLCTIAGLQELYCRLNSTRSMSLISDFDLELRNQKALIAANEENARYLLKKHASFLQLFDKTLAYRQQMIMLDDSSTIRSITIITLIYLAFSVVGTVMSMPLFHLDEETNSLEVSPDIWMYFAISAPLTILSVTTWLAFSWLRRRAGDRKVLGRSVKYFSWPKKSVTTAPRPKAFWLTAQKKKSEAIEMV